LYKNVSGWKGLKCLANDAKKDNTHLKALCLGGTTQVSQYQKSNTNLDFTEVRDSELQWRQLGHMQICTSPRQITTPAPHHSTNSVKALKAQMMRKYP